MGQKWIIDVLADLRAFAEANELPGLARHLKVTEAVARQEITPAPDPDSADDARNGVGP